MRTTAVGNGRSNSGSTGSKVSKKKKPSGPFYNPYNQEMDDDATPIPMKDIDKDSGNIEGYDSQQSFQAHCISLVQSFCDPFLVWNDHTWEAGALSHLRADGASTGLFHMKHSIIFLSLLSLKSSSVGAHAKTKYQSVAVKMWLMANTLAAIDNSITCRGLAFLMNRKQICLLISVFSSPSLKDCKDCSSGFKRSRVSSANPDTFTSSSLGNVLVYCNSSTCILHQDSYLSKRQLSNWCCQLRFAFQAACLHFLIMAAVMAACGKPSDAFFMQRLVTAVRRCKRMWRAT